MRVQYKDGDLIAFTISRRMTSLNVSYLIILEDLVKDGVISEKYYDELRKKCLDNLNTNLRETLTFIDKFDFTLK